MKTLPYNFVCFEGTGCVSPAALGHLLLPVIAGAAGGPMRSLSRAVRRSRGPLGPAGTGCRAGVSLAEVLAALVIGSMVLVALLGLYRRCEQAAAGVHRKLDNSRLPGEILQRIAEDLDRQIAPGSQTKVTIANTYKQGFPAAKLTITRKIADQRNQQRILEEIVWQSGYDVESGVEGLVLYRGHSGLTLEDKLLDKVRQDFDKAYPMVPICAGVTCFEILVPTGDDDFARVWTSDSPPGGIVVTISFAPPEKGPDGSFEVPEQEKFSRTIAIDRTRKIAFKIGREAEVGAGTDKRSGTGAAATGRTPAAAGPGLGAGSAVRSGSTTGARNAGRPVK